VPAVGRLLALGAVSAALLAGPATTDAAITVGSPLTAQVSNNIQQGCGTAPCTFVNPVLPEPGANVASPLTGVLVRWRMLGNASGAPFEVRVLRPAAGGQYTGAGTGAPEVPVGLGPTTFATRLPVQAGDLVGLDSPAGANWLDGIAPQSGAGYGKFDPALADGSTGSPAGFSSNLEVGFNGDVEFDADRDVFGDETQDYCLGTAGAFSGCPNTFLLDSVRQTGRKPKVKVTATVPGAGTVQAGSPSDPALASASAKRSLKPVSETLTSTTYQQAVLALKLTKSAKRKLAERRKLKAKVKVLYRPPGGPAVSQTRQVNLKT
jgi:hypothetical protein